MLKKTINRLKKRYKYASWYLGYRIWHNFTSEQREGFRRLMGEVESFKANNLLAVGNEGVIHTGLYRPSPAGSYVLKLALNKKKRSETFGEMLEALRGDEFPFLCEVPEFGVSQKDPRFWYQVLRRIDGMMIGQYLQLTRNRRLETAHPVTICVDLLEQTQALHDRRVIAPNVDAENVLIQPDRSLVRIDLDPYRLVANGKLPRYPLRRLFRLLYAILEDFGPLWREQIREGRVSCDPEALETLLSRLKSSSLYGYDDPNPSRHRNDRLVDPGDCFTDLKTPLDLLHVLRESFDLSGI